MIRKRGDVVVLYSPYDGKRLGKTCDRNSRDVIEMRKANCMLMESLRIIEPIRSKVINEIPEDAQSAL